MNTISRADLRKLLIEKLSDDEFDDLCFYHFREVHDQFTNGMMRGARVRRLIEYCEKRNQLHYLLEKICEERPDLTPATPPPPPTLTPDPSPRGRGAVDSPPPPPARTPDPAPRGRGASDTPAPAGRRGPGDEGPPAPAVVRAPPLNPLFPVTIAEWQDELVQRNEKFGRPTGYWCYVRPGRYLIGGWKEGDAVDTLELPAFWIAKYPVTVQQYRQFINAGGYTNEKLWTPNGWEWKKGEEQQHPYLWGEERFRGDNQPVVGVSWYEAVAFARWLTARLNLPQGYEIRLPTEAEWEAAAAYDTNGQRHAYPWGEEEPDASRADFGKDSGKDKPAPVGKRPAGAAVCGAQDMAGSVWEWTCSDCNGYAARAAVVVDDFVSDVRFSVRGGCWSFQPIYLRASDRYFNPPGAHLVSLGFRPALPLP